MDELLPPAQHMLFAVFLCPGTLSYQGEKKHEEEEKFHSSRHCESERSEDTQMRPKRQTPLFASQE